MPMKKTYGYWTVVGKAKRPRYWICQCICGKIKEIRDSHLKDGSSRSCRCKAKEDCEGHGYVKTRTYNVYVNMLQRCYNKKAPAYRIYGQRGITVCSRWKESFLLFLSNMGECPSAKHSIDRINNDGDYSPENCRWATRKEQSRNRRQNKWITHNGITMTQLDWSIKLFQSRDLLRMRLQKGWSLEKALTTPRLRNSVGG